jgi:rare lipoprotein A (peptidoglycan hydrolase)
MLTLVVTSTPATGALAALSNPTDPQPTAMTLSGFDPQSEPTPMAEPTPAPAPTSAPEPTPTPPAEPSPTADPPVEPTPTGDPAPPADPASTATPTPTPEAAAAAVVAPPAKPRPRVVAAARRPGLLWAQLRRGLTVRGVASWYGATRGYAGLAHVAMPGARFRTRGSAVPLARVCAGDRCTVVRVVDACGCYARTSRARVADLSWTTLRRLGLDPRRGVYNVNVTLIRG